MVIFIKSSDVIKKMEEVALKVNGKVNQHLLNGLNEISDNEEFSFFEDDNFLSKKVSLMENKGDLGRYSDSVMVDYFLVGLEVMNNEKCLLYQVLFDFIDYSTGNNSKEQ